MKRQQGFGAIAAIVILVILAGMSAAIVSIGTTQHITSAQDVLSAKAFQAARAGNEWGLFQALKNNACAASETLDLVSETGFNVTVYCEEKLFNEGESSPGTPQTVTLYEIQAVACPAASCPSTDGATVAGLGYVERRRVVIATK
jgi:MSHA biogenesis protein MshP